MDTLECALEAVESQPVSPSERQEALVGCMGEMGQGNRRAIELRYGDGLSCQEVSRRLKVSLNSLYSRLSRLRDALKDCVERRLGIGGETA